MIETKLFSKSNKSNDKSEQSIEDFCKSNLFEKSLRGLKKLKRKTEKDLLRIEQSIKETGQDEQISPILEETKSEITKTLDSIKTIEEFYNGIVEKKKVICKR